MTYRIRQVLVVTMLTTALCADSFAKAAPQFGPEMCKMARALAARVSTGLGRTVHLAYVRSLIARRATVAQPTRSVESTAVFVHGAQTSPFLFRLPPPLLA